jgi:hypothetical protein
MLLSVAQLASAIGKGFCKPRAPVSWLNVASTAHSWDTPLYVRQC